MEVLFNWCCEVMQSLANFTGFALFLLFVVKYVQYREKKRFIKQLEAQC